MLTISGDFGDMGGDSQQMILLLGEVAGPFPETVGNIRELQVFPFAQMARMVSGHGIVFVVGAAGLVWWVWHLRRRALLIAVPVLLAMLPVGLWTILYRARSTISSAGA